MGEPAEILSPTADTQGELGRGFKVGIRPSTPCSRTHPAHNHRVILSQTAIYALRCLAVLNSLGPGERMPGPRLSEHTGVPREYLAKIMRQLAVVGIVNAVRGNSGGFSMNRPAAKVRLMDVLKAVDMQLEIGKCAFFEGKCKVARPCALHGVWSNLQQKISDWADGTTVADFDQTAF